MVVINDFCARIGLGNVAAGYELVSMFLYRRVYIFFNTYLLQVNFIHTIDNKTTFDLGVAFVVRCLTALGHLFGQHHVVGLSLIMVVNVVDAVPLMLLYYLSFLLLSALL